MTAESKKLQTFLFKARFDPGDLVLGGSDGEARHDARIAHEQREVIQRLAHAVRLNCSRHQSRLVNLGRQQDDPCPCENCQFDRMVLAAAAPFLEA